MVGSQDDVSPLGFLVLEHVRDDMGIRDCGHGSETVVLGFAIVDLTTIILDRFLGDLEPPPG